MPGFKSRHLPRFGAALSLGGLLACGTSGANETGTDGATETGSTAGDPTTSDTGGEPPPGPDIPPAVPGPEVIDVQPPDGAVDVALGTDIVITFSEPMAPGAEAALTIVLGTEPVAVSAAWSPDGTQLTLRDPVWPGGPAPVSPQATLAVEATSADGRPLDVPFSWSWAYPSWFRVTPPDADDPAAVALGVDESGAAHLVWIAGETLHAARQGATGDWDAQAIPGAMAQGRPATAIDTQGQWVAAWLDPRDGGRANAASFDGAAWADVTGLDQTAAALQPPALATGTDETYLAWPAADGVYVHQIEDGSALPYGAPIPVGTDELQAVALAVDGSGPVLATLAGTADAATIELHRYDGTQWSTVTAQQGRITGLDLQVSPQGDLHLAWSSRSDATQDIHVAVDEGGQWVPLGHAVDVEIDAESHSPRLAFGSDGVAHLSWIEGADQDLFVARWHENRWQALGGALDAMRDRAVGSSAVAMDAEGRPVVAWVEGADLQIRRSQVLDEPPLGLAPATRTGCELPSDEDPTFPTTLADTGCYADVATQALAPGIVPYGINSPLWSDGALKRRFIAVTPGEALGFTARDAWFVPDGTVLIKEFWLERTPGDPTTAFPVETRLLVKRCAPGGCRAPWQGYSYRWSEDGTVATLLENTDDTLIVDWSVDGGTHQHTYPARKECTDCHASAPGGTLGLQTAQMDRRYDYGEVVDDQLRALQNAGVLAEVPDDASAAAGGPLPRPADPSHSLDERVRSYLHSNCAHCHRSDGRWPVIDLGYDAVAVEGGNICQQLVPGDAENSLLYQKDAMREPDLPPDVKGEPMPPLGTRLPDNRQLAITKAWIDDMSQCP